jgi:fructose-bisphosphate aldolase class I
MFAEQLVSVARELVAPGKGVLAADESFGTIKKRFDTIGLESTEETRRDYREMLFTTPEIEDYISGVILYDETIRQTASDGTPMRELLNRRGIKTGIKVDMGAKDMALHPGEKVTEGLDGLRERLAEYRSLGAVFTKWRAVITIGEGIPTEGCINANAHALARFAALSQEAGLVPIVESEVLMDGDHTIEQCEQATNKALHSVFNQLHEQDILLEGMLLKPNMVISGKGAPVQAGVEQVAEATLRTLRRRVPAAVPGIVFLSGGQSPELATEHLNAINSMDPSRFGTGPHPWQLTFSYARALQEPPLMAWCGDPANIPEAQRLLLHRARCNSAAHYGRYLGELEKAA